MPLSVTAKKHEVTDDLKVTVLKHLINGREADFIATATGLTRDQIGDVKRDHGYPDIDKMEWARDILAKRASNSIHEQLSAAISTTRPAAPTPTPRPDLSRAQQPSRLTGATMTVPSPTAPVPGGNPGVDVIAAGLKSGHARTRALADKITGLLADLEGRIAAESEEARAKAKADRENAARKARIAELEAEIAALRKRDSIGRGPGGADPNTDPCPECGREFPTRQGLSLHRRRVHEGFVPDATKRA